MAVCDLACWLFYRATACNATHGIAIAILSVRPSVCPSVRPSVRCVYCDKTKQRSANILIPHETACVTLKCLKGWLKERLFRFLSKSQRLNVSSAVNLLSRSVSQISDGRPQCLSHHPRRRRDLYSAARSSRRNYLITIWCGSVSGLRESWLLPPFTCAFWISSRWHHTAVARSLCVS